MLNILSLFGQSYDYLPEPDAALYATDASSSTASDGAMTAVVIVIYVAILIATYIPTALGLMKMFQKAGVDGAWKAWVPIYNFITLLRIIGRPGWWIVFYFLSIIPFLGIIPAIAVAAINSNDTAKSFGKDIGYAILIFFLPMVAYLILGYGDAKYLGKGAQMSSTPPNAGNGPSTPPAAPTA